MKKNHNARKELMDLYLYLDMSSNWKHEKANEKMKQKYESIKNKYDKIYGNRHFTPMEWNEYYGLFKTKNGIGIDPKRMQKTLYNRFTAEQMKIMNNRKTTYFHPKKESYLDYYVNNFIDVIDGLQNEFKNIYQPIIKQTMENINKERKQYSIGDIMLFQQGIYEADEAEMSARMATWRNEARVNRKMNEVYISLLSQFFHNMCSRIEAVSILMYSSVNPNMKRWSRDKLYDNINLKGLSSRDLPSFKYHDRLYSLWNFIKHNNMSAYNDLKDCYPDVLCNKKYEQGQPAKYYIKFSEKLINELLEGVKKFFIEWCELNCNENYKETSWNYEDFFTELIDDEIENYRNPLGLEF